MLIGPPGAGKSYIANSPENPNSLENQGYKIFSSDKKIGKRIGGFCLFPVLTIKRKKIAWRKKKKIFVL